MQAIPKACFVQPVKSPSLMSKWKFADCPASMRLRSVEVLPKRPG
jgi:hypothetical protein